MSKRYYYYVGVKYPYKPGDIRHCDIFRLCESSINEELELVYLSLYAFVFGSYNRKYKAVTVANYHNYIIDN